MMTNMELVDKISTIRELISKARNDNNYSSKIMIPEDMNMEEFFQYAYTIADNAAELIEPNRMENLQDEEYAEAYATVHSLLDGVLTRFPEYIPSETARHI